MKKALLVSLFVGVYLITWTSCAGDGPTSSSDLGDPAFAQTSRDGSQPGFSFDPTNFSCANVEEVHVRFSDPGYIDRDRVAVYAAFTGIPPGEKVLRIWWNYTGQPEQVQNVDLGEGEVQRDNDLLYDVEKVVEHTYEGLDGKKEVTVRVELILKGGSRGCARNRDIVVESVPPPPNCAGWGWRGGCWYTAPSANMSCEEVCAPHGGFDEVASQHTGNDVGRHFWPSKADGHNWRSIECSSRDNDTNWGANGTAPDPDWRNGSCYVNCACRN